jgi:hypothetical protein
MVAAIFIPKSSLCEILDDPGKIEIFSFEE